MSSEDSTLLNSIKISLEIEKVLFFTTISQFSPWFYNPFPLNYKLIDFIWNLGTNIYKLIIYWNHPRQQFHWNSAWKPSGLDSLGTILYF